MYNLYSLSCKHLHHNKRFGSRLRFVYLESKRVHIVESYRCTLSGETGVLCLVCVSSKKCGKPWQSQYRGTRQAAVMSVSSYAVNSDNVSTAVSVSNNIIWQ